jgi:predicted Zn-dependent protease
MRRSTIVDRLLARAARADAAADVIRVKTRRREVVARSGTVEQVSDVADDYVCLRVSRGGRTAYLTSPVDADPAALVATALATLRHLPATPPLEPAEPPRTESRPFAWLPLAKLRASVGKTTALRQDDLEIELRTMQEWRMVEHSGTDSARARYESGTASLVFRTTLAGPSGEHGHAEHAAAGPDLSDLLRDLAARDAPRVRERASLLAGGETRRPPVESPVVLEAHVVARLVALAVRSFFADAVVAGRSRLTGRVGRPIADENVTLVDDPSARGAPFAASFDDEGVATSRRSLVERGVVTGYLANRRFASAVEGSSPGSAWRRSASTPPRPGATNLLLIGGSAPIDEDPALRIVESYGLHLANEVTGDFSMGAGGVLVKGGVREGLPGLTVAGNVFDLLERVEALGVATGWTPAGGGAIVAAPELVSSGVVVGGATGNGR